jgi:hypothetical protein
LVRITGADEGFEGWGIKKGEVAGHYQKGVSGMGPQGRKYTAHRPHIEKGVVDLGEALKACLVGLILAAGKKGLLAMGGE